MESQNDSYFAIYTPQQLMKLLGYPDEVECLFSELFENGYWHGRWDLNNEVLEFSIREHILSKQELTKPNEDHTKYDFYHPKIIESGMCEDYGIIDTKNERIFVSHTQHLAYKVNALSVLYCLKKYIPLVKRATA